ncbi:hypothetical protein [Arenicella chitinivorans]|uniref:hypothetical protein n=1 Tax=Arenicella chitinivorans TaxID=1329800 RepID=UPI0016751FDB|nr:hypothetical protein [Arenicella chitinivorans]
MEYITICMVSIAIFYPLVMPWGRILLLYCLAIWCALWGAFFFQIERETNPSYEAGIVSDGVILGIIVIMFMIVIIVRAIFHYIWRKNHATAAQ